jgi:hypothetical protein
LSQQRLQARWMAAMLRREGLTARLAHFGSIAGADSVVRLARVHQPRVVVLSTLFGHLLAEHLQLASRLRAVSSTTHLTLAGPLPALDHARLLAECPVLDSVLCAEPDAILPRLVERILQRGDCTATPGLAWRAQDGRIETNLTGLPVVNVDHLPDPARDGGIPLCHGVGFATVEASRGCCHTCSFCLPCAYQRDLVGVRYRLRSVTAVVDEIERLYGQGTRLFLFDDEQFIPPSPVRAQRVHALAAELRRRHMRIAFTIKCRPDDVDAELMSRLRDVGLIRVYLGLESGCQETLNRMRKGVTVAQNAAALGVLDSLGLVVDFRCLIFHPWSTLGTIRCDLDFLTSVLPLVPTVLTFHEVVCYAGTPIHAELLRLEPGAAARASDGGVQYTIADPAAERLRHIARRVFGVCQCPDGVVARTTQDWYRLLLARRFDPTDVPDQFSGQLRQRIQDLNAGLLRTWRAMVDWAVHREADLSSHDEAAIDRWTAFVRGLTAGLGTE